MSMDEAQYDNPEEIYDLHSRLVSTFQTGKTKDLAWRKWQLKQLWWMIEDNEQSITTAINNDLNRPGLESIMTDLVGIRKDILKHLEHIDEWTADQPLGDTFVSKLLGLGRIRKEPLGVSLIIGAWNFPFLLIFQPLISAITAGCCAIIKPSELTPTCLRLLKTLVSIYLDNSAIGLVCGGVTETTQLLGLRFNHIFFTGSASVGRIVSVAAAKNLTPVTLELGGQSPAIVCKSADVNYAAKCIAYSKFLNAGQICLSVNHVLVDPSVHDEFVKGLEYWNEKFLAGQTTIETAIVNLKQFDRLTTLIHNTKGNVVCGGKSDRETRRMDPAVVSDVDMDDALMKEEIFGPICPVLKADFHDAYRLTNQKEHPLAMYIFSKDKQEVEEILNNTNSGGVTVNNVILHASLSTAPFGGVGGSGHGYYHGAYGFDSFTHLRTVMHSPGWLERILGIRYPPYTGRDTPNSLVFKANFKRGESINDQRRDKLILITTRKISLAVAVSVIGILVYYLRR